MTIKGLVPLQAPAFVTSGLTGATAATRWVGGTTSGAPASGTFVTGDFVVAQNGHVWICTAGGSPGTWADAGGGASVSPATTVVSETTYGLSAVVGTLTSYAREDHSHGTQPTPVTSIGVGARTGPVTLTAADIGAGTFPGANSYSGLQTYNAGLTIPSGQPLTTGTRSVYTGSRTTTTNASDTVNLGTFSTTGGAIELRIHAHLAAPAAGTTASVTKVYEIAANATMGTLNTWYLCLPADASANAAATNDFALEVERTAANTFVFRFRQKSIGVAGSIAFSVETLGDTAVTFTPSSTVTAAPAAVSTIHPSNAFTAAAGNIGIGTEAPTDPLHLRSGATQLARFDSTAASGSAYIGVGGGSNSVVMGAAMAAGGFFTDAASQDGFIWASGTLRVGVTSGGASIARISANGVAVPNMSPSSARVTTQETTTSTTFVGLTTAVSVSGVIVPASGRVRITHGAQMSHSVATSTCLATVTVTDNTSSTVILAAADNDAAVITGGPTVSERTFMLHDAAGALTAGHSLTVTCQYRVQGAGTGTFLRRTLVVEPCL